MAYFQILTIAIALSASALWRMNFLLGIAQLGAWSAMLAFHLTNRPAGVVAGDAVDTAIILVFVAVGLGIMFVTLSRARMRKGGAWGKFTSSVEGDERNDVIRRDSELEYRDTVRRAVRPSRRRR